MISCDLIIAEAMKKSQTKYLAARFEIQDMKIENRKPYPTHRYRMFLEVLRPSCPPPGCTHLLFQYCKLIALQFPIKHKHKILRFTNETVYVS